MSDLGAISRPYAEAVFALANETKAFDKWEKALQNISVLSEQDELKSMLNNPTIPRQQKREVIEALVRKTDGDDEVVRLTELLIENDRFNAATSIYHRFETLRQEVDNTLDVTVESAIELDKSQKDRLEQSLEKRFGKKINLTVEVNAAIIGGVIIHAGDTVIDDSVKNKLERLSSQLRK